MVPGGHLVAAPKALSCTEGDHPLKVGDGRALCAALEAPSTLADVHNVGSDANLRECSLRECGGSSRCRRVMSCVTRLRIGTKMLKRSSAGPPR